MVMNVMDVDGRVVVVCRVWWINMLNSINYNEIFSEFVRLIDRTANVGRVRNHHVTLLIFFFDTLLTLRFSLTTPRYCMLLLINSNFDVPPN
jgi:hypothetical protein